MNYKSEGLIRIEAQSVTRHAAFIAVVLTTEALFLCASLQAQTGMIGKDSTIKPDPGGVKILWPAQPGHSYMLKSATNLAAPFTPTTDVSTNLTTATNYNSVIVPTTEQARFFQLLQRDTDGPRIDNIWPADGAFAINPQEAITARITDATGVNLNSLSISVGTNPPVQWPDSRLVLSNNYLTYLPAIESWGPPGATVTARLRVADTLGNWYSNNWSFRLVSPPVLASNVVFVDTGATNDSGPNLTLISATGSNIFLYSYNGASSGITNGMCLVNTNVVGTNNHSYGRVVRSFIDSPSNHTVSVFTRRATLEDVFQSGSIRFHAAVDPCLPFGNATLFSFSNPNINIQTTPNTQICVDGSLDGGLDVKCHCFLCTCPTLSVWVRPSLTVISELALQADVSVNKWSSGDQTIHLPPIHVADFVVLDIPFQVSFTLDLPWSASFDGTLSATVGVDDRFTACVTAGFGPDTPSLGEGCTSSSLTGIHNISGCGSATIRAGFSPGFQVGILDNVGFVTVAAAPYMKAGASAFCSGASGSLRDRFSIDLCAGLDLSLTLGYDLLFASGSKTWSWNLIDCTPLLGSPFSGDLGPCPSACVPPPPSQQALIAVYQPVHDWLDISAPSGILGAADYRWGLMLGNDFLPFTDDEHIFNTRGETLHARNLLASDAGTYAVRVETPGGVVFAQSQLRVVPPPPTNSALVWIPAGTFLMGSPTDEAERSDDEVEHSVTISRGFYIGQFEVTQNEYLAVAGDSPSHYLGTNLPVETVTWNDATNYCRLLTQQQRLNGQIPTTWAYRLPTEAEWEYACRTNAGGPSASLTTPKTAFCYGSMLLGQMANFHTLDEYDSSIGTISVTNQNFLVGQTTVVGTYAPSPAGLYDMHGNVGEWCQDWYGSYPTDRVTDPQGPATGANRVFRGGSWNNLGVNCRAAKRFSATPTSKHPTQGFRVVLAPR